MIDTLAALEKQAFDLLSKIRLLRKKPTAGSLIDEWPMSVRTRNCLKANLFRYGYKYGDCSVADFVECLHASEGFLTIMKWRNCGLKTMGELARLLTEAGVDIEQIPHYNDYFRSNGD